MPQGRRKVPFSTKQKKQQIKNKRQQKKTDEQQTKFGGHSGGDDNVVVVVDDDDDIDDDQLVGELDEDIGATAASATGGKTVRQINVQKCVDSNKDVNRYALHFFDETPEELQKRREDGRKPFAKLPESALEVSVEEVFTVGDGDQHNGLDLPKRPKWDNTMSTKQLEANEQKYFRKYLNSITKSNERLSYFDLNLETWRQLWRVLEMSDIVLMIADIRHPVFHFPPSLYNYVVNELKKDMILVLNKVDLVDSSLIIAWTHYLKNKFPELHVLAFASYAGMKSKSNKKRIGKLRMASNAAKSLQEVCQKICGQKADLTSWRNKIEEELHEEVTASSRDDHSDDDDDDDTSNPLKKCEQKLEKVDLHYYDQTERFKDGVVTIGCVGHPNVGKSSLLNAIMGRKVVSVSRTPGHTKHFQTIYLTPTVKLCDCPGLVFPSMAPKELQVLMGCFPIAQLREPNSAIGYLAQRINVQRKLHLQHPNDGGDQWSAYDVCEAWAIKRRFFTAKAARPDVYRAANHLLRMALDGRTLCLAFYPPDYLKDRNTIWSNHSDIKFIELIRGQKLMDYDLWDDELADNNELKYKNIKSSQDEEEDEEEESDEEVTGIATKSKFSVLQESD
ncbi:guanine nucleotide-binding protein-like 1 [Oppia nitens]|uniref:guanine nucleotide-binding protein-like 1 n=1 Tax=Oppia nitens TaxID=1686743 RepID=UPI0023DB5DC4|nr:guanine nucleotide-binding protein-like 1 [Oppia nitens]